MKIAIDAMGGDYGPLITIQAVSRVLDSNKFIDFELFGNFEKAKPFMKKFQLISSSRINFIHTEEVVESNDRPSLALRVKKQSSMRLAIDSIKEKKNNACVSAGNTGALLGIARFVLKTLPGVSKPAICGVLPGINKVTRVLDLGANIDCSAQDLRSFAIMGSVLSKSTGGILRPTVGLLNIGEEEVKGNDIIKATADLLAAGDLNYCGFVEGDDIFKGTVDVIVCDGFVGNVALKAGEGAAKLLSGIAREEFSKNIFTKLSYLFAKNVTSNLKNRVDHRNYNGASLLGLRGTVVKSHGSADSISFQKAIMVAVNEVSQKVPEVIGAQLEE
ncbi:MAG: phosphate acyltransferase [Methylococcaceae bacterium TMED69]|nr:MAG: phosphate acyltransferase [Methylococcaceae bacterium TMED69]|tara:strand:- start:456 stop:1448 length:993 start_codon:yes stop_codon:yes gene_type:complete